VVETCSEIKEIAAPAAARRRGGVISSLRIVDEMAPPSGATGLSDEQLEFFHREGYVVLPELLPKSVTDALVAEIDAFLETKGDEEMSAGRLSSADGARLARLPFDERAAQLCTLLGEPPAHMPPTLAAVSSKSHTTLGMHGLMTTPAILEVVSSVIGDEILVHPQFNMRGMLPQTQGVIWHQDLAFLEPEAEPTPFCNFWIPLSPIRTISSREDGATNGALMVLPRSHTLGALPHYQQAPPIAPYAQVTLDRDACQNETTSAASDERAQKMAKLLANLAEQKHVVVDELPVGGAVLFTHKTLHASLPNFSDVARWSLDIRYSVLGKSADSGADHHDGCTSRCIEMTISLAAYVQACLQVDHTCLDLLEGREISQRIHTRIGRLHW
jgi:phytanoyl-CoA hydroxylase